MANGRYYNATVDTDGPSTVATQFGAYGVGGRNGWHSHPGLVAVTLTAGGSWLEGSQLHSFTVAGSVPIQLTASFITAKEEGYRTDRPAPACAAALGLD